MGKGNNTVQQEVYNHKYNINKIPLKGKDRYKKCTHGIYNADEDNAYSCYINATFQLLASNTSFVREVLDFMVSHKIIITENLCRKSNTSNTSNTSFVDELDHMKQNPTLALFLLMTKISRVVTFHQYNNINVLFLKFYSYIREKLQLMEIETKTTLYPDFKYIDVEEQMEKIDNIEKMENNIAYMLPVIFRMILDNYEDDNRKIPTSFSPPIFSSGSELVPFLEFFLDLMKFELDKYIPHPKKQPIVNPVDIQFRIVVSVSLISGNGEEKFYVISNAS